MTKKISMCILIIILLATIVYADRTCQNVQEANVPCQIITPIIVGCSTYDLYNSTLELNIDDGEMTEIGSTGTFNFTFNQPDAGTHKGLLCDNTSFTVEVADYSSKNIYDEVINRNATAQAVWDYNLSENYPQAEDDNYIAGLAGEQLLQGLRFIIQILFGGF